MKSETDDVEGVINRISMPIWGGATSAVYFTLGAALEYLAACVLKGRC